jgi:hypothetical protein
MYYKIGIKDLCIKLVIETTAALLNCFMTVIDSFHNHYAEDLII